ncbi:unnamed protein product [Brassicogethes aeneus]|uniref:carbonic anhydrase n=1 Tax=Brassicogethes aeneus TaxID=1431903 RepID=A0A9P0BB37_BRAAE|nr:unnamed protein product [Brassicogethes aeneus]
MHTDCKSIQDAINSQWVTVLGILVEEISKSENKSMEAVTNQISEIENADKNKAVQLKQDILVKDFLPKNITSFYRYFGSLTTPAYNEGVLWTVFKEPLRLSKQYIENIKCIRGPDGNILENTFRPIQPLNDRIIYATSRTN